MRVLDLFSGIGGFALGLERAGMKTVAFCEKDGFCQKVLRKHWPSIPIYEDVRTLPEEYNDGPVELICGGYPCQPFSLAGNRKGKEDDRHLWPAMFDCIKKFRPRWVIGENVAGHINMGLDEVLTDLESENYETWPIVIPACAVNAPHRRDRVWIIGHSKHNGLSTTAQRGSFGKAISDYAQGEDQASKLERAGLLPTNAKGEPGDGVGCFKTSGRQIQQLRNGAFAEIPSDDKRERSKGVNEGVNEKEICFQSPVSWRENFGSPADLRGRSDIPEPLICRVDDGFSSRVDRLRALGNAVVPQIPEIIGKMIVRLENEFTV